MLVSIKGKVAAAGGAMLVLCIAIAGCGLWTTQQLTGNLRASQAISQILRQQMHADMMHDALRADVLAALVSSDDGGDLDPASIAKDTRSHANDFLASITGARAAADPELAKTLGALTGPVDSYARNAERIVDLAATDRASAQAALPAFFAQFRALEDSLSDASDKIEARVKAETMVGEAMSRTAFWLLSIAMGLGVAGVGLIILLASRTLVTPLVRLTTAMTALAGGRTDLAIPGAARTDEIGAMARATETFRQAVEAKARLEADTASGRAQTERERQDREAERARQEQEQNQALSEITAGLEHLARGNLTYRITATVAERFEATRGTFNRVVAQVEQALSQVLSSAGELRLGADQIASASVELSRRTESQAATLEEAAAALHEVTQTVRTAADGADQAQRTVTAARADAARSDAVVNGAVSAMQAIEASSRQISQIIGVIDEIAFQTNLLALNAGVEAARAGDSGRGFAVVASEVRALAQRSAAAAQEIKGLILASEQQVANGVDMVDGAGQALQAIAAKVSDIDALVSQIAASSREQASALAEVNVAVSQMDQMVQQNAAMAEESTAATETLKDRSAGLVSLTSQFQVTTAAPPATSGRRFAAA